MAKDEVLDMMAGGAEMKELMADLEGVSTLRLSTLPGSRDAAVRLEFLDR